MWYWDGRRWIPAREHVRSRSARRELPFSFLIGLLLLDVAGFLPGLSVFASVIAAVILLAFDARGFLTLNGLIKWRRMSGGLRFVMFLAAVALFQFMVIVYIAQRALDMLVRGVTGNGAIRRNGVPVAAGDRPSAVETHVEPRISAAQPDAAEIQRSLVDLLADARNRLPPDVLERVSSLVAAILDVLPAYRSSDLDAHDRYAVARTAGEYLPSSLRGYLRVSPAYRSVPLRDADWKTANQVLIDQLDLMTRRMQAISDAACRKEAEQLLIHERFLRSKFGDTVLKVDSRDSAGASGP